MKYFDIFIKLIAAKNIWQLHSYILLSNQYTVDHRAASFAERHTMSQPVSERERQTNRDKETDGCRQKDKCAVKLMTTTNSDWCTSLLNINMPRKSKWSPVANFKLTENENVWNWNRISGGNTSIPPPPNINSKNLQIQMHLGLLSHKAIQHPPQILNIVNGC